MADTPFLTARNPYALAEIVLGHPIDWNAVADRRAYLEEILQTPYEELFDPKHDSPVYLGFALDENGTMSPKETRFPTPDPDVTVTDIDRFPATDVADVRRLSDLKVLVGGLDDLPVRSVTPARAGGWSVEVGQSTDARLETLGRIFDRSALDKLSFDERIFQLGWTPPGAEWKDTGSFFKEAAEFFDPLQGGLGDCWLIAAMASVAWAMPYTISQRSRATGTGNESFTNLFEFTDPGSGAKVTFEATDKTLVYSGTTVPLYGRSKEDGEIWPALVEKAYAMWRAGTTDDRPNLTVLNGGDPVHASAALTGRKPHYTGTASSTAAALLHLVKSNSVSYRTVNPMTAWTYGSGDDAPDHVNYGDASIVACHAYSVLGWTTGTTILRAINDFTLAGRLAGLEGLHLPSILHRDYIVLRNPWGFCESTVGVLGGTISMRDVSFWRSIDLDDVDGVFAIDVPTFKKYFAGIGVAL